MLEIVVPKSEAYDEVNNIFISVRETVLHLEHSLLSISKWESKWHEPFLSPKKEGHTTEQLLDYIKCMTLTRNVDPYIYNALTRKNLEQINAYINDPMTATTITDHGNKAPKREIITSELIYYWMVNYNIPFECEKWHINRLIMLIRVCSAKANPSKMSPKAILAQNRKLNAARRRALGSRG